MKYKVNQDNTKNCNQLRNYIDSAIKNCYTMKIYLISGIKLEGKIIGSDEENRCLWICDEKHYQQPQLIFIQAVATISIHLV